MRKTHNGLKGEFIETMYPRLEEQVHAYVAAISNKKGQA